MSNSSWWSKFVGWLSGGTAVNDYNDKVAELVAGQSPASAAATLNKAAEEAPSDLVFDKPPAVETRDALAELTRLTEDLGLYDHQIEAKRRAAAVAAVKKARSYIGKKTVYKLGKSTPGKICDCSGFSAAAYGYKRDDGSLWSENDSNYHFTNSIVADALDDSDFYLRLKKPEVGCFVVYPGTPAVKGKRGGIGHIGIVSEVPDKWDGDYRKLKVIHCSGGNYKRTGDAIQETDARVWGAKLTGPVKYRSIFVMPKIEKLK